MKKNLNPESGRENLWMVADERDRAGRIADMSKYMLRKLKTFDETAFVDMSLALCYAERLNELALALEKELEDIVDSYDDEF